jgi:peptidyl-prolyl cis-trans isomerase B (cyclophilin B)
MTKVTLETTLGKIVLELNEEKAPKSVKNFLEYLDAKHYEGTVFHRVIDGFMIQGGGYDGELKKKPTRPAVEIEADNGLLNDRGTVAMARSSDPNSATAQFFINVVDNAFLNFKDKTPEGWGYAVFGTVVEGMDVVDKIKAVPTGAKGSFTKDCPLENVVIESATREA